jgi:adenine-specific DNA-methyltransferase
MPTLNWIGKKAVVNHHREVPYRLIHCDKARSVGDPDAGNLLVQGDNLEALKALLPYYAGKVKCIYIDPPYNTGNEGWVYNDNVNSPEIKAWLGATVGKEAEDLSRHDKWLCMMYPRLRLLKEFLSEDGAIAVSIDENEVASLTVMMDEIFGRSNRVANIVWQKGKKGDAKLIPVIHEYICIYVKDKSLLTAREIKWRKRKEGADDVLAFYQQLIREHGGKHDLIRSLMMAWYRSLKKDDPRKSHKHYNWSDDRGLYFADNFAGPDDGRDNRPRYPIIHPETGEECKMPSTGWRWEEQTTKEALAQVPPRIHFGKTHNTIPCRKSYLNEIDSEPFQSVFYKDGRAATLQVEGILGAGSFPFPKDVDVLVELLAMLTNEDDIVLDSFAGSGSTGHAVWRLNQSANSRRRFILVEMDEKTARERTAERLRAVNSGYRERVKPNRDIAAIRGGFRFCTLGEPLFDADGDISPEVTYADLAAHVFFCETGSPIPRRADAASALIGVFQGRAIYLLHAAHSAGVASAAAGNVLTGAVLESLPLPEPGFTGPRVVYAEGCSIPDDRLTRLGVTFKQVPYQIEGI